MAPFSSVLAARRFFPTLGSAILLTVAGCGRERLAPEGEATDAWQLGEVRTYPVAATPFATVEDPETGSLFRFPTGGGTLSLTPILSGPQTDATHGAFEIAYTGSGAVEMLVDHDAEDFDVVLGYVPYQYMMLASDETDAAGWLPLPSTSDSAGVLVFALQEGGAAQGRFPDAAAAAWKGTTKFKRLHIAKGSTHADMMKAYQQNIGDALRQLIHAVPPARQVKAMTDIDGPLNATLYVDINTGAWFPSKPKYVPFWDWTGFVPRCAIVLNDLSPESVAHEVGHYLHHVLVGNQKYAVFASNYRTNHSIGSVGAKNNLIEEPAYFAEYFLKGVVNSGSPEQGTFVVNGAGGNGGTIRPWNRDFTDVEGFATAVLASLTRERSVIYDFENARVAVPVVDGDTLARFQAAFEIIALGTDDIMELRDKVEAHLTSDGAQQAKLPAMLEPLGWSYHARCRFVNDRTEPRAGLTARALSKVGATEYLLARGSGSSAGDGVFRIQRVFPGRNHLRVYHDGDSTDVTVNVPWEGVTTEEVNLGDIKIGGLDLLEILHRRPGTEVWASGYVERAGGDPIFTAFGVQNTDPGWPSPSPLQWSGTKFSFSRHRVDREGDVTNTRADSLSGEVSPDGRRILTITMRHEDRSTSDQVGLTYHSVNQVTVVDIPVTSHPYQQSGSEDVRYYLQPAEVKSRVTSVYYLYETPGMAPIESRALISDDGTGWTFLFKSASP